MAEYDLLRWIQYGDELCSWRSDTQLSIEMIVQDMKIVLN
jgi:hypothetical protein